MNCTAGFWAERCAPRSWGCANSFRTLDDESRLTPWRLCS